MTERLRFVVSFEEGNATMAALCREFGISRKTGNQLLARYAAEASRSLSSLAPSGPSLTFPNSTLYKDKEELEALQLGAVQMLAPSNSKFGPIGIRRERKETVFKPAEAALFAALAIAACAGIYALGEQSSSDVSLLSLVGRLEAIMNIPTVCGALILGGLVTLITPTTASLAQSNDKGASAPRDTGASAPNSSTPNINTNTNPTKHRYWRHRGGRHPHFGSRRVRT